MLTVVKTMILYIYVKKLVQMIMFLLNHDSNELIEYSFEKYKIDFINEDNEVYVF